MKTSHHSPVSLLTILLTILFIIAGLYLVGQGFGGYKSRAAPVDTCSNVAKGGLCGPVTLAELRRCRNTKVYGWVTCRSGLVCANSPLKYDPNKLSKGLRCQSSADLCAEIKATNTTDYAKCCLRKAGASCGTNVQECMRESGGAGVCEAGLRCTQGLCVRAYRSPDRLPTYPTSLPTPLPTRMPSNPKPTLTPAPQPTQTPVPQPTTAPTNPK